jgi:hypothetical protein
MAWMRGALRRFAADPVEAGYLTWSRVAPSSLFRRHSKRAQRAGLREPVLVLSFDCDTQQDIDAAPELHRRRLEMGAKPVYAVPGELLQRGRDEYRSIADSGAEFLNHGHVEHTVFDRATGAYTSTFFYDRVGDERVRRDIELGHEDVIDVIGTPPMGFRTPHFGTYQRRDQLRFLHSVLAQLGYAYSSSTVPLQGFRHGPVYRNGRITEFPVTGTASAPLEILDSWGCFAAPDRVRTPSDYAREAKDSARLHLSSGPTLLNFYVDPSHVHDRPEFFAAVESWLEVSRSMTYSELFAELSGRLQPAASA